MLQVHIFHYKYSLGNPTSTQTTLKMRANQENNDGGQHTDPSPKLKMDGFYACPVCPRNFRNGLALGGHLASHRRAKKNADQGATVASNTAQVNDLPPNSSSQPQAPTPVGSNNCSKRSLKFNFTPSQPFMSSPNCAGESSTSTQPSAYSFHRVIQRCNGWRTAERLQTRDFLSKINLKHGRKDEAGDHWDGLDLTLHL